MVKPGTFETVPISTPGPSPEASLDWEGRLISALADCVETFCEFNATKDMVLAAVRSTEWSDPPQETYGTGFSELIRTWGQHLDPEQQQRFSAFLEPEYLKRCYMQGMRRLSCVFGAQDLYGVPVLIRQSVLLYQDTGSGDLLGITYGQTHTVPDIAIEPEGPPLEADGDMPLPRQHSRTGGISMTMEECYQKLGGNYADVMTRLPSLKLVEKFIGKFLEDRSYDTLCAAMKAGDRDSAFRSAHTLKGVCANLSFTRLMDSASQLTELLRPDEVHALDDALPLLDEVRKDYQLTVQAILAYMGKT